MNTIVMNTLTAAVSEYTGFLFQSVTPTKAGSALGLYSLTGGLDETAKIVSYIQTGETAWNDARKKRPGTTFLNLLGSGAGLFHVVGRSDTYTYSVPVRAKGASRVTPGKGIQENYLAFGYSNPDGAAFQLDRIEVPIEQYPYRRT